MPFPGKKDNQVKLSLDDETFQRLKRLALADYRKDGEMARLLIEWAIPQCEATGSIRKLRELTEAPVQEAVPREPSPRGRDPKGGRLAHRLKEDG